MTKICAYVILILAMLVWAQADPATDAKIAKNWDLAATCYEKMLLEPNVDMKSTKSSLMDTYFAGMNESKGIRVLEELCIAYPASASEFHFVAGRRYMWNHQYTEAAAQFKQCLGEREPSEKYILCCLSALDFDGALAYLPKFIADYPSAVPNIVSSQLYRWKFKVPAVIEVLRTAIHDTPGSTKELQISLADCYVATHEYDLALEVLKSVVNPPGSWHVVQAKYLWATDQDIEAITELKLAIKLLPAEYTLQRMLLEYYRGSADWANMLTQTEVLVKVWPQLTHEWLLNKGWALLDLKRYDDAVVVFKECLTKYPEQRWTVRGAIVSMSECLYKSGKVDKYLSVIDSYYAGHVGLEDEHGYVYAQALFYGPADFAGAETRLLKLLSGTMGADARNFLITVYQCDEKYDLAAAEREKLIGGVPVWSAWTKRELVEQTAEDYYQGKNYVKAAELYKEIMKDTKVSKEKRAKCIYNLAVCQKERGFLPSALTYLHRIISDYAETTMVADAKKTLEVWEGGAQ